MEYIAHIGILFCIYAGLAISLNLVVGNTGLLSMAHASFFGLGAYATAVLMTVFKVNFFFSLLAGMLIACVISFMVGKVFSRFKDDYYALSSMGFNIIMFSIFVNWESVTSGVFGISGISGPALFGYQLTSVGSFFVLAVIYLLIVYLLTQLITKSIFGNVLIAIREDEEVLTVFGFKVQNYKLMIFCASASMAAVAGSLYASYISFVDPSSFTLNESIYILTIIILGGLASIRGSIIGALILTILPEILRMIGLPADTASQVRQIIYGLILIVAMLYKPEGIAGKYKFK